MILGALVSFLHFLAAFGVIITVVLERIFLKRQLSKREADRIRKIDGIYGLNAMLVLAFGFLRVFYFEKGSEYYFANPIFHLKLTLFIIIGLLSIYPTVRFMKWKKQFTEKDSILLDEKLFVNIKRILNIELGLLVLLLLSASLMAKGVFY